MERPPQSFIQRGDLLVAGQTLGEPTALLQQLFDTTTGIPGLRLFGGMSLTGVFAEAPAHIELSTFVGLGRSSSLISSGRMSLVPCHMSDLTRCIKQGPLRPDIALVLVSPPDTNGMCSLGLTADYIHTAVAEAPVVLAEINEQVPRTRGDTAISIDRIDAVIRTDRPLPEQPRVEPTSVERAIADHVAPHVRDGACLLIGVGRLGEAVLSAVADRHDLGVHSGMIGDTILEMADAGIITNARKRVDTGLTVTGSVLGSSSAVALAARSENLRIRSIDYTNDPTVVARLGETVCVNSAIEVDLLGQVNAESVDGRYIGGVGGAVDFLRGVARAEGTSIVALPSTAKGGAISRIVPVVERVTALRTDVDVVATEHGIAQLRGVSEGERASRLIALAAPHHRESLELARKELDL